MYQRDVLGALDDLPRFDVVYSLGLVEHFADPERVADRHVDRVRPGGFGVIGVPNFRGLKHVLVRVPRPEVLATHSLAAMARKRWVRSARSRGLDGVSCA